MADISKLGNKDGIIYVTELDGTTVLANIDNTPEGVASIKKDAALSAPMSGERLSFVTIPLPAVMDNNMFGVVINGVPIVVNGGGTTPAGAANSINIAATTPKYTAEAVGNDLKIYAAPGTGSGPNGFDAYYSYTVGGATQDDTKYFSGGSSGSGSTDSSFGKRFWLNADPGAVEGVIAGAIEITDDIIAKSTASPLPQASLTIAAGLIAPTRLGSTIALSIETEGGAGADNLDIISSAGFSNNDMVIIRGTTTGHVVTLRDKTVAGGTANIALANQTAFSTGAKNLSIALQLIDGVWNEIFRTPNLPLSVTNLRAVGIPEPVPGIDSTALLTTGNIEIEPGVSKGSFVITGSPTLTANVNIIPKAAPTTPYKDGDEVWIEYKATPDLDGNKVSIFGQELTDIQAESGAILIRSKYKLSNTTWYTSVFIQANDQDYAKLSDVTSKENGLGNPIVDNMMLISSKLGIRSWAMVPGQVVFNNESTALDTDKTLTAGENSPTLKITSVSTTETSANRVITLVPSAVAGVNNNFKIIIGAGRIGSGFTWKVKYGTTDLVTLIEGSFQPTVYEFHWNGSSYSVTAYVDVYKNNEDNDITAQERVYVAEWSFAQYGGSVGTITLPTKFPAGTILKAKEAIIECIEALTSGGAATIEWGYTGVSDAFDAATAYSASPYTGANLVKFGTPAADVVKLTAATQVTMTIAGAGVTAGYLKIFIPVIIDKI